jgi:ribonuclease R
MQESEALWQAAHKEAAHFSLPGDWAYGLDSVDGITIDDAKTKDRDDAIWFVPEDDGYKVHVSIADVGSFVPPRSKMAAHAEYLGETRYVKSMPRPMLPRRIGERALSLLDTQVSPTLTASLQLNAAGEVVDSTLERHVIRPMRATYEEVAAFTHGEKPGDPRTEIFRAYEKFAINLLKARQRRGAFAYYNADRGLMTDEEGRLIYLGEGVEHSGELIVQEFMILANAAVASYMRRNNIPGIFRQHRISQKVDVEKAVALMQEHGRDHLEKALAGMGRAWYSTVPGPHEALQLPEYAHNTSPLRRYADLVNHWNILAFKEGRAYPFSQAELERIATHLNEVREEIRGPSQHFKDKDERISGHRLHKDAAELGALAPGDFLRVVKAALRTGEAPQGFRDAIAEKIATQKVRAEDAMLLLYTEYGTDDWKSLKTDLMQYLAGRVHDASTVAHIAIEQGVVEGLTTEPLQTAAGFGWRVEFTYGGKKFSGEGTDRRNERARHVAILHALAELSGVPVRAEAEPVQGGAVFTAKSHLNTYTQKNRLPLPLYNVTEEWSDGSQRIFKATTIVHGKTYAGHGTTKKEAETNAAAEAVKDLGINPDPAAPEAGATADNPISFLQERSAKLRLAGPDYVIAQDSSTPAHLPRFNAEVTVVGDDGKPRTFHAQGPNKATAKANAARKAVEGLHNPPADE